MAAIASPSWAEAKVMDPEELEAFNIVRGEMNGDEFLWDAEYYDDDGNLKTGAWKSWLEKREKQARETD